MYTVRCTNIWEFLLTSDAYVSVFVSVFFPFFVCKIKISIMSVSLFFFVFVFVMYGLQCYGLQCFDTVGYQEWHLARKNLD